MICVYNYFGKTSMKINIFLILILTIIGFLFGYRKPQSYIKNYVENVKEPNEVFVEPLDINIPTYLKTNFKNGIDYCKTQNIAQNGAFENCVLYYIYERSKTDHGIILNINTYCSKTTTNECYRRNCIEKYLLSD